jgi:hypothetical protein
MSRIEDILQACQTASVNADFVIQQNDNIMIFELKAHGMGKGMGGLVREARQAFQEFQDEYKPIYFACHGILDSPPTLGDFQSSITIEDIEAPLALENILINTDSFFTPLLSKDNRRIDPFIIQALSALKSSDIEENNCRHFDLIPPKPSWQFELVNNYAHSIKRIVNLLRKMRAVINRFLFIAFKIHNSISRNPNPNKPEPPTGGVKIGGSQHGITCHATEILHHTRADFQNSYVVLALSH